LGLFYDGWLNHGEEDDSPVHFNAIETAALQGHTAILRLLLQHAKGPVSIQLVRMWVEQNAEVKEILMAHGVKEE
jgi:hypothetical protein